MEIIERFHLLLELFGQTPLNFEGQQGLNKRLNFTVSFTVNRLILLPNPSAKSWVSNCWLLKIPWYSRIRWTSQDRINTIYNVKKQNLALQMAGIKK